MYEVWKKQFTREKLFMNHEQPHIFVKSQWQRKTGPSVFYLTYRWAITLFLLGTWIYSIVDPRFLDRPFDFRVKWLIYLTNWGYTVCIFQALLCSVMLSGWFATTISTEGNDVKDSVWVTGSYKIYWVSNIIATDVAFGITVLYWALIFDEARMPLDAQNIFVHGTNSVVMFIELCVVAHPMRLLHCYWTLLFSILYIIFSAIYYAAGGVSRTGQPFIYPVLDWRRPGITIAICIGVLFFMLALHVFSCCVYWLRRYVDVQIRKRTGTSGNASVTTTKRDLQGGFDNVAMANDMV